MKNLSLVLVVMTVGFFIWFGNYQESSATNEDRLVLPQVGYKAPAFSLENFEGRMIDSEEFEGKPVLLNFWASWCPPCRVEMPHLISVYEQFSDQVDFVGINMAHQDRNEAALEFIAHYEVPYDNLVDYDGGVARQFRVTAFPTTVVIDHKGIITYRRVGGMTERELMNVMHSVLEEGSN
ncbi:MAG: TlpA family protein disulfide reductase [Bacillaceae bacterium]|nr:TlpA family protein disulfide reductase [Bacillaceae bacterium]